jgi:hypothetical protein
MQYQVYKYILTEVILISKRFGEYEKTRKSRKY